MTCAPIALFVYNRPDHTRRTIDALKQNILAQDSDLIVLSDAAKSEAQAEAVREVRKYIREIVGFKSVTIVEREVNLGLAHSIIDGVTSLVNEHGRIIVLEDDLVTSPYFLTFMNDALDKYENEQQVIQVSGYMFPVKVEIEDDALFLPLTTSWGWATWKRAWQLFDPDANGYAIVKADRALRKRFNLDGAYDYFAMLEDQLAGRVDSWAIRWYLSTFLKQGITLYPRQSLIINMGFDGSGTHGRGSRAFDVVLNCNFTCRSFPKVTAISDRWATIRPHIVSKKSLLGKLAMLIRQIFFTFVIRDKHVT